MAKFIKLKLNDIPDKSEAIQWRLIIDNIADLDNYHSLNATLNMEAFMTMERNDNGRIALSHTGAAPTRHLVIQRLLNLAIDTTPIGEKVYPIIEVAKMSDAKTNGMLKYITTIGAIQVNEAGGYCGLDDFIKTWDAEILETIEKLDYAFPLTNIVLSADTIILENSPKNFSSSIEKRVQKEISDSGVIKTIYNLREIDSAYLIKCIGNCRNVIIETQAQSKQQVNLFMQLFQHVASKNIYLYVSKDVENRIKNHADFNINNNTHKIIFNN